MNARSRRTARRSSPAAALYGLLALLAAASPAQALVSSCTVTAGGVAFGVYDPTVLTPTVSTGTISVSCVVSGATGHNPIGIALSAGNSGTFTSRTMLSGPDFLNYNLFLDAAYTQVWGDGSGVSLTYNQFVTPGKPSFDATVYGMMPAAQSSGSGTFNDTITVSVSF